MDIKINDKELLEKLKDVKSPSVQVEAWLKDYFFKESKTNKNKFNKIKEKMNNPELWTV